MNRIINDLLSDLFRIAENLGDLNKGLVADCGDGVLSAPIADATARDFEELCTELGKGGAILLDRTSAENRFFAVSAGKGYIHAAFYPARGQMRITYTEAGDYVPETLAEVPQNTDERSVTQVCPDDTAANFGMCYVFALGAGHFLVYDGNGDRGEDHTRLYDALIAHTPAGQKPVVDAWIATHPHWDHISNMAKFADTYADAVEVRNVLCNLPALNDRYFYREMGDLSNSRLYWIPKFMAAFPQAKRWKLHAGQCFTVGDAKVEVLYTHEECSPWNPLRANDCSTVTTVTLAGKRFLLPADLSGEEPCGWLRDVWGNALKSDFYQAAHHGWDTEAMLFYPLVQPDTVLWPLRLRDWDRIQKYPATQCMVKEMQEGKREFLIARTDSITVGLGCPGKETNQK